MGIDNLSVLQEQSAQHLRDSRKLKQENNEAVTRLQERCKALVQQITDAEKVHLALYLRCLRWNFHMRSKSYNP